MLLIVMECLQVKTGLAQKAHQFTSIAYHFDKDLIRISVSIPVYRLI